MDKGLGPSLLAVFFGLVALWCLQAVVNLVVDLGRWASLPASSEGQPGIFTVFKIVVDLLFITLSVYFGQLAYRVFKTLQGSRAAAIKSLVGIVLFCTINPVLQYTVLSQYRPTGGTDATMVGMVVTAALATAGLVYLLTGGKSHFIGEGGETPA